MTTLLITYNIILWSFGIYIFLYTNHPICEPLTNHFALNKPLTTKQKLFYWATASPMVIVGYLFTLTLPKLED